VDLGVIVRVQINEARRDDAIGRIQHTFGRRLLGYAPQLDHPPAAHANVGPEPRQPRAVHDRPIADDDVVVHVQILPAQASFVQAKTSRLLHLAVNWRRRSRS